MASKGEARRGTRRGPARVVLVVVAAVLVGCVPLESGPGTVELSEEGSRPDVLAAAAGARPTEDSTPSVLSSRRRASAPSTTVPSARARPPASSTTTTTVAAPAPPPPPEPEVRAAVELRLGPAQAQSLEGLPPGPRRDVAAQALTLIRFDWVARLPGWQLRFREGRQGYRGLTYPDRQVIEVYVRDGDTPSELAHVTAHELGHAVDVTHMNQAQRSSWLAARGFGAGTTWFAGSGASDFATGAGDFAECFAWSQAATGHWFGELGPPPDVAQVALLEVLATLG